MKQEQLFVIDTIVTLASAGAVGWFLRDALEEFRVWRRGKREDAAFRRSLKRLDDHGRAA